MHYYKRNLGDYAKKAGRLSMLQHGAYTLLIDACYDREQFPTLPEAIDWAWASSSAEIEAVEFVLRKFFTLEGDRYVQGRIQEEIAAYRAKSETNARIAHERETMRKEKRTNRAQVVNDSPPNQEPLTINHKTPSDEGVTPRKRSIPATTAARPDDVSEPVWQDFQRLRREKRAPLTDTALAGVRREAGKAGVSMETALAYCCEAGWQGFNAGWYADRQGAGGRGVATQAVETYAQRAARQRVEEMAPMAARKQPGSAFDAAQRFMQGEVIDVAAVPKQLARVV